MRVRAISHTQATETIIYQKVDKLVNNFFWVNKLLIYINYHYAIQQPVVEQLPWVKKSGGRLI